MSKYSTIRWRQSDDAELKRNVKNFNAKISRLEKKYPKLKNVLPERVTVEQMKELIDTRKDFNREMKSLQRFTARTNVIRQEDDGTFTGIVTVPDSKYNLKVTKWQKEEMTRQIGYINKVRKQQAEKILNMELESQGQKLHYTRGDIGMGSVDKNALDPMKAFFPTMSRTDLNKRFKAIKQERQVGYWMKKQMQLARNVMNGILANYNAEKYKDDVDAIISAIENMSFNEFYEKFMTQNDVMELVSPPPGTDFDDKMEINLEVLKSTWVPNYKPEKG